MSSLDSYDQLPYDSNAFSDTHPSHLYAVGRLFGMATTKVDHCRVLELGCASGGNIIPMAYYLPTSEFVGIELSARQALDGQAMVRELDLRNIRIEHLDVMRLDESFGKFDYIIAHGIYSWVPANVQDKIMQLCRDLLTANGLAYISYNVKPGWNIRSVTRDILLHATQGLVSPKEKLARARETIRFLHSGQQRIESPASGWLRYETSRLLEASDSYLYHEYLETHNEALLFSTFVERAKQQGMQYVGDTDVHTMFVSTLGDKVLPLFEGKDDLLSQEQYSDFLRMRPFRQSIICRDDVNISREIDLALIQEFHIVADLACTQSIFWRKNKPQNFRNVSGREFSISHPITKAALVWLADVYPNGLALDELTRNARRILQQHGATEHGADDENLVGELFNLFIYRGVRLVTSPSNYRPQADALPRINKLAQTQAKFGHVTGPLHVDLTLDAFSRFLISLCDGNNTENNLLEKCVVEWRKSDELRQLIDTGNDEKRARERIQRNITSLLKRFARHGIVSG